MTNEEIILKAKEEIRLRGLSPDTEIEYLTGIRVLARYYDNRPLEELHEPETLLNDCYNKEWVVYCKPPFKTAACVVEYLGRHTHRVAISNNRIFKLEDGQVSFKWRDYRDSGRWKVMTVSAQEFIRRFLMHILPPGFMKIRHFGFLSSRGKQAKLPLCKQMTSTVTAPKEKCSTEALLFKILGRNPQTCRSCGFTGLVRTGLSPPFVA